MKKFIAIALAAVMMLSLLAGCGSKAPAEETKAAADNQAAETTAPAAEAVSDVKIGFIFLHDENSTYDNNFIKAANAVKEKLGLSDEQVVFKTNVPESNECYEAAADLADRGCDIVFADSFGHESYLMQAAQEFPEVQFCHATGTNAHTAGIANFHNAFASIYEGRYLAGIAAGMKMNEMIEAGEFTAEEAKLGYVGAFTYAEVISGYTAFFLGAKSVCPTVTMDVQFTGSWYDETGEKEAANKLIEGGAKIISQHADSMGAPTACETAGVPNVSYNGSTINACPNTFLVSSAINWAPYFEYIITSVMNGEAIDTDWCGTTAIGSVELTAVNEAVAAEGTQAAIDEAAAKLASGELHVFDTAAFTVEGATLTSYLADVDTDAEFAHETEVIADGYFHESEFRAAPYFDLSIDGITLLNSKF